MTNRERLMLAGTCLCLFAMGMIAASLSVEKWQRLLAYFAGGMGLGMAFAWLNDYRTFVRQERYKKPAASAVVALPKSDSRQMKAVNCTCDLLPWPHSHPVPDPSDRSEDESLYRYLGKVRAGLRPKSDRGQQ